MDKTQILQENLQMRKEEIMQYQINIDNYTLAIQKIDQEHAGDTAMDLSMRGFKENLESLLQSSLVEQRKAQIIHDVIESQLASS